LKDQDASSESQKDSSLSGGAFLKPEKVTSPTDPSKVKAPDRIVESPPCEVSSTTAAEIEKPSASDAAITDKPKKDETDWHVKEKKSDVGSLKNSAVELKYNGNSNSTGVKNHEALLTSDDENEFISKQDLKLNADGADANANVTSPGKVSDVEEIDDEEEDLSEMENPKPGD